MRCVSYTRTVSCMENGEIPKDIIGQQNQRIQDYIKKRGWTLGKKYSDRKKDVYEETAYLQMKMDAIAREFDCVVLDSMFRCGRNSNVAAEMFRSMFVPAGVYFAVVEDDFCSCDVSEEETYKYLDEKAAAYRNKFTIDQVRKYNESKIYPKYGFKYKEGKMELEIDPEAAKHVRRIFELLCEGHSCNETAKIMTADGIECSGNYVNKLWGRPIKDENAPWKMAQVKRIIYNRQYIGEWERTIDGKKKMFSCPVLIDKETFEKAHSKLSVRKYSDHVRGKTPLNPFSNRIFDKDSGIALKLYPHQRLKIRIFRLSYPKPKEIVYERGHIPFDEVYEKVHKIIENEKRQAERIAGMIGSFDWEYEKEIRILKIKAEAKLIFQKMLLIESRNLPLYNSMIK